jgi:hypothetical protein
MTDNPRWHFGNAAVDGSERRGWLVGAFMETGDIRLSNDVEIKWGVHPAGDRRESWFEDEKRTSAVLLVNGRFQIELSVGAALFQIELSVGAALLAEPGDYAMWGPGIGHSWRAEEDSVVITVRWPAVT